MTRGKCRGGPSGRPHGAGGGVPSVVGRDSDRGARHAAGWPAANPLPYILRTDLGRGDGTKTREAVEVEVDDAFAGVFDSRRKGIGDLQQRFLRGALALAVAGTRDQARKQ